MTKAIDLLKDGKHQDTGILVRRLVSDYVRPYVGKIALAVFFMLIFSAATGSVALLMEQVVDQVFAAGRADALWLVAGAVVAVFIVKGTSNYMQARIMAFVGLQIIANIQTQLYRHVIGLDLAFFHGSGAGRLITRFTNDVTLIRTVVSNGLTALGKDLMSAVFLIGVMFYQDWKLAFIATVVLPIAIRPIARLGKRMRRVTANTQAEFGEFSNILNQTFQGVRHVKAYAMEEYESTRIDAVVNRIFEMTFKSTRLRAAVSPLMETLGGIAVAIIVVYGGNMVIAGETTAGKFFSFITALLLAYEPMKRLANIKMNFEEGLAAAERVFSVLDHKATIVDAPEATELEVSGGQVTFENVVFRYGEDITALDDLSLTVPAGKTAALVGMSGAGKSTILNLIPRFYDIERGRILIDGQDVKSVSLQSLRSAIGLVSQEITLFDDTIRGNIAYGKPDATEDEIREAARQAAALDFILEQEHGFDTPVGENGIKLSGGQRQRIAIARAMLKNAPILLLDEATSALDTESERFVQAALENLMRDRTTLVIAHRLSTVIDADIIFVVDRGRVAEQGSHDELLAKDGIYARLYAMQFAEEAAGEQIADMA
ncbi:MAG: ABC transporter transmembrane domain-containing protein [Rhodospirillales bacterium]